MNFYKHNAGKVQREGRQQQSSKKIFRMRRLSIFVLLAMSLLGQARGLLARPIHTSHIQSIGMPRLPLANVYSSTLHDRSVCRMRGGASSSTSLSSLPLRSVNYFLKHHPFVAAFLVCSMKSSLADAFAQFIANKRRSHSEAAAPFDVRRNLALMCYGGTYLGCGQEYVYNHLFTFLFGAKTYLKTVITKVSFDMFLVQPLISLPIAYIIKALVMNQTMGHALDNYFSDIKHNKLLQTCWLVWIPAQSLVFSVIPKHLRISFIACVSFFWLIIFSTISASKKPSVSAEVKTNDISAEIQMQQ